MGLEGIVSKRKDSAYRSGRSPDWLKMKNPAGPAVKREKEEDWGKRRSAPEPNATFRVGADGETGDCKGLTLSNSSPALLGSWAFL
jgi:hypothetical protein